jgi:hypothetical protein
MNDSANQTNIKLEILIIDRLWDKDQNQRLV